MCGILALFKLQGDPRELRALARKLQKEIRHRGPDWSGTAIFSQKHGHDILCHERLTINDETSEGEEPLQDPNNLDTFFICNGEIYNYGEIVEKWQHKYKFHGHCDVQAIGPMWQEFGKDCVHELNGMFGFVVYDAKTGSFFAARDHVGIIPVYYGSGKNGEKYIASELKAISSVAEDIQILPPGHYITDEWKPVQWYKPKWQDMEYIPSGKLDYQEFRDQLTEAVRTHLMSDVPFGLLISGGVDSSLVAAIAVRLVKEGKVSIKDKHMDAVHSFCIGKEDSPDIKAARKVAEYLGTTHHEFTFTLDDGLDSIPECIYHMETFNPTTIRAGTPMFLMARKIKALGIKVVLSGEGADELLGGYLYFHKAPNEQEFHKETIRKVKDLYRYDLLRANKTTMAWGVEARPPFLYKTFIEYCMNLDPKHKHPKNNDLKIEKYILRKAFDTPEGPYIPSEVLWRQKEQFSDGVGYSWVDGVHDFVQKYITDDEFSKRFEAYPTNTPTSKEMLWFRKIFERYFPSDAAIKTVPFNKSIACSTEHALEWDESFKKNTDESGRAILGVHSSEKSFNK